VASTSSTENARTVVRLAEHVLLPRLVLPAQLLHSCLVLNVSLTAVPGTTPIIRLNNAHNVWQVVLHAKMQQLLAALHAHLATHFTKVSVWFHALLVPS